MLGISKENVTTLGKKVALNACALGVLQTAFFVFFSAGRKADGFLYFFGFSLLSVVLSTAYLYRAIVRPHSRMVKLIGAASREKGSRFASTGSTSGFRISMQRW